MSFSRFTLLLLVALVCGQSNTGFADIAWMKQHCGKCHAGPEPKGDFSLHELRKSPDKENANYWINSLERVRAGEMPPAKHNRMTKEEKSSLEKFLQRQITLYELQAQQRLQTPPRRLNNRELENSLRDVLLLEHIGSNDPLAMLLSDTLHDGFDTHGETLGMSEYHLDQYVTAVRKVLDGVILVGDRPASQRYEVGPGEFTTVDTGNRKRKDKTNRRPDGVDIRGPREAVFCQDFTAVPTTGFYRVSIKASAIDRHVYSQEQTGIYDNDPIVLRMITGSQWTDIELPVGDPKTFQYSLWLTKGTPLEFMHHTDGLRLIGNGNFKFQNRIAHDYIKANKPDLYEHVVKNEVPKARFRSSSPSHWVHWVPYWQGPRPLIAGVTIEGPVFENWPPKQLVSLLGDNPKASNAVSILKPMAERAWRRDVTKEELKPIAALVESQAKTLGDIDALKEGIVAILVSPSFLMLNSEESTPHDLFATKLSYLLGSTSPDAELLAKVRRGELDSFEQVRDELTSRLADDRGEEFLREFPYSWLQLDRINFMAPDVDRYPLYEKKEVSEDMVNEVLTFFRHNVRENRPVPELLAADYSFVNADLAKVYGLVGVPDDSVFRKHTFKHGRRGGFIGMGAFLTLTADTLSTSPIHRAVYVMENFMGIHPVPPPANVEITEPDIRSARTIREVLQAHRSDASCAACHQNIDPFGYAFENFDPIGAWRDDYIDVSQPVGKDGDFETGAKPNKKRGVTTIPIDASASFPSGATYKDITEFRKLMQDNTSRDRFVSCFVVKLLTYANGVEPKSFTEIEAILKQSAMHDYRIIETMAAVIDSPLFRETPRSKDAHLLGEPSR